MLTRIAAIAGHLCIGLMLGLFVGTFAHVLLISLAGVPDSLLITYGLSATATLVFQAEIITREK